MVPPNNDDLEEDDDEQEEEEGEQQQQQKARPAQKQQQWRAPAGGAAARPAASRKGEGRAGSHDAPAPVAAAAAAAARAVLPLALGPQLVVVALGRVEWLNDAFHNEKTIFPVGYTAQRTMATPASASRVVRHTLEVVVAPDGISPLFRWVMACVVCWRGGVGAGQGRCAAVSVTASYMVLVL